ncbi:OTU-like cysteine protease domain-containing protein, putative [Eimeria tenella]|uniref:OTU-like cysteine protease domain-containing protein, putative n=1 Tax=Eimeria tenella TaxID=5802 RepID=U6KSI0_EIMTE|nr:OTU-like cysteine protease domain-containing protein, putative [Eimeria tenella]CDJ38363.1 OTU-like cysteine protease domain-containing protein, putative [Eimeria tenella]|eukprot:XP_013229201.1 OTU-like cysteine protease domain-containing protein, putative [Eimeria tenella]
MAAADTKQSADTPTGVVSVNVAEGAPFPMGENEGFRLGADSGGTQILQFGCHCCKSTNVLICTKTADGGWVLCRAPAAPQPSQTATALERKDVEVSTETWKDPGDSCEGVDVKCSGKGPGKGREQEEQEVPTKAEIQYAVCSSGQSGDDVCRDTQDRGVWTIQSNQRGTLCCTVVEPSTPHAAPVVEDVIIKSSSLRPLARCSNSSTCSSWEGGEPRIEDDTSSSTVDPVASQTCLKDAEPRSAVHQVKHQKHSSLEEREGQGTEKLRPPEQQQQHSRTTQSLCRTTDDQVQKDAVGSVITGGKEKLQLHYPCSNGDKISHSEAEAPAEDGPKLAASKEQQEQNKLQEQPQQHAEPQKSEQQAREYPPDSQGSGRVQTSRSNSNISSTKKAQDSAIAAMAPYMSTRECEGDGNCLYRAFSDQLYGSQDHHLFLRWLAVDVMLRCKDTFEAFVDESEGPFERWLQTKRTYGEWADYREMHALLLLFGTPIFVFDEHLQLLQAFEPDPEKKRLPNREGESLTPFRLMWHGKLGHYTSLHFVKEGFPIARGLMIGQLEAEGLARLVLSLATGTSSTSSGANGECVPSFSTPARDATGLEEETLAECLQVSAQELAGIAAEQELILAAIKRQRLQQLLPQTTRVVDEIWNEARKEQEGWTARLVKSQRSSPLVAAATEPVQHPDMPLRATEKRLPPTAAPACASAAAEDFGANSRAYATASRIYNGPVSRVPCPPTSVCMVTCRRPSGGNLQHTAGPAGGVWSDSLPGHVARYDARQRIWQEQLHLRQRTTSTPIARYSQGPAGRAHVISPVQGLPAPGATRSFGYTEQYAPQLDYIEQQRHCMQLPGGRLVAVAPSGALRPVRHATLQHQRQSEQQQQLLPTRPAAVTGQRQATSGSNNGHAEDASWFSRWMGRGNNS